jgi:Ca2+-binding EF-hand superfamily protein/broad specificity phosphatase PhoE
MFACICGFSCGTQKALDRHVANSTPANLHGPTERSKEIGRLQQKYTRLDLNGDRRLDFDEFARLLRRGDPGLSQRELVVLFNGADKDSDGCLDFDEFVEHLYRTPEEEVLHKAIARHSTSSAAGLSLTLGEATTTFPFPVSPQRSALKSSAGAQKELTSSKEKPDQISVTSDSPTKEQGITFVPLESPMGQSFNSADPTSPTSPLVTSADLQGAQIRLVLVRHAKSANKTKEKGTAASLDPELSDAGFAQAEALGDRLGKELKGAKAGSVIVGSSPMQRCLQTILPTITRLTLANGDCLVQGACYEYGCAGTGYRGSSDEEILAAYPDFQPVGFSSDGYWDYRGESARETQFEARERAARIVSWIWSMAEVLSQRKRGRSPNTLVLCIHQTMADLICQLLIDGTSEHWVYGEVKYKLQNTALTEVMLEDDGRTKFGYRNDAKHLFGLKDSTTSSIFPNSHVPESSTQAAKQLAELRAYYKKLDKSGDGVLDFHEIATLLRMGNPSLSDNEVWNLFNAADKTNDGDIDFREFVEYIFCGRDDAGKGLLTH